MGLNFKETSVNKIDQKKFEENFNKIDWSAIEKAAEISVADMGAHEPKLDHDYFSYYIRDFKRISKAEACKIAYEMGARSKS